MLVLKLKVGEAATLTDTRTGELLGVVSVQARCGETPGALRLGLEFPTHLRIGRTTAEGGRATDENNNPSGRSEAAPQGQRSALAGPSCCAVGPRAATVAAPAGLLGCGNSREIRA